MLKTECVENQTIIWHRLSLILALFLCITLILLGRTELAVGLAKPPYDLLLHGVFFGFLALLIWYGNTYKYKAWLAFFIVSILTVADEVMQLGIPGRVGSGKDVLAGMLGAIIVLIILSIIKSIASEKIK